MGTLLLDGLKVYPENVYQLEANKRKTRKSCEIYSKLSIRKPELVFLLLILNIFHIFFWSFNCILWTGKYLLGILRKLDWNTVWILWIPLTVEFCGNGKTRDFFALKVKFFIIDFFSNCKQESRISPYRLIEIIPWKLECLLNYCVSYVKTSLRSQDI